MSRKTADFQRQLDAAKVAVSREDWVEARALLVPLARQRPKSFAAYLLGRVEFEEGKLDVAQPLIEAFLKDHPRHPWALILKSSVYLARGQVAKARRIAEAALAINPNLQSARKAILDADAEKDIAEAKEAVGRKDWREARALLKPHLKRRAGHAAALLLAEVELEEGKPASAALLIESHRKRHRDDRQAKALRSRVYAAWGKDVMARYLSDADVAHRSQRPSVRRECDDVETREGLNAAKKAIGRKEFGKARMLLGPLLEKNRAGPPALLLARVEFEEGQIDAADSLLDSVLESRPGHASALAFKARLHLARGQTKDARRRARAALALKPGLPMAEQVLSRLAVKEEIPAAKLALSQGELARARGILEPLVAREGDGIAAFLLARVAFEEGDHEAAEPLLKAFQARHPEHPLAHVLSARLSLVGGELNAAKQAAQAAQALKPGLPAVTAILSNIEAQENLIAARTALERSDWDEARARLEQLVEREPHGQAALLLARAELGDERLDAAQRLVEVFQQKHPSDAGAYILMASIHKVRGAAEEAERAVASALEVDPHHGTAQRMMRELTAHRRLEDAKRAFARRAFDEARELLAPLVEQKSGGFGALLLARVEFEAEGPDAAEPHIDAFLKSHPEHAGALLLKARLHLARGETAEAKAAAQASLQREPSLTAAQWLLDEAAALDAMTTAHRSRRQDD